MLIGNDTSGGAQSIRLLPLHRCLAWWEWRNESRFAGSTRATAWVREDRGTAHPLPRRAPGAARSGEWSPDRLRPQRAHRRARRRAAGQSHRRACRWLALIGAGSYSKRRVVPVRSMSFNGPSAPSAPVEAASAKQHDKHYDEDEHFGAHDLIPPRRFHRHVERHRRREIRLGR
jgi:hypothetical protein